MNAARQADNGYIVENMGVSSCRQRIQKNNKIGVHALERSHEESADAITNAAVPLKTGKLHPNQK